MLTRRMGFVAVAVLATAGSVFAQNDGPGGGEGRGRGGPGGGFGRGGFGRMGGQDSYLGLLRIDEVKTELKLTDDQNTKIAAIGEEMRNAPPPEGLPDFREIRDLPDEEQQAAWAKWAEFNATREKEANTKVGTVLDEAQMKRLRGLWVQRAGVLAALNNADLATELKLTDDQKTQLATQREEQRASMRGGFGGRRGEGGGPPPGGGAGGGGNFAERMREIRKASDEKALAVLTDEQKAALTAIEGDKFTFPPPQFGGGPGGGRGRNRGEGGDRPNGGPQRDAQ
jgi:Spy/CpxP family protein refolding chaperone